jgi:ABC-type lipoprotein export system ATPase subunit
MVSEVERRATLLARAEAARKDLIVADAPTDGLDDKSAQYIHNRLTSLHLAGVSILYLTSGSGPKTGPDEYLRFVDGKLVQ